MDAIFNLGPRGAGQQTFSNVAGMPGAVITANLNNFDLLPNGNNGFTTSNLQASAHVFGPYGVEAARNRAITERLMDQSRRNGNNGARGDRRRGGSSPSISSSSSSPSSSSSGYGGFQGQMPAMSQPARHSNGGPHQVPQSGNRAMRQGRQNRSPVMEAPPVIPPSARQPPPPAPPSVAQYGAPPSWVPTRRSNSVSSPAIPPVRRQSTSSSIAPNGGMPPVLNMAPDSGRHPLQRERTNSLRSVYHDARTSMPAPTITNSVTGRIDTYNRMGGGTAATQSTAFPPSYVQQRGLLGQIRP